MTTDRGYGPPGDRGYALPPDRGYAPTGDRGFGPPPDRRQRFVHCARCHVLQPLGSAAPSRCVACGAPIQRWVAHPPPGGPTPKNLSSAKSRRPYVGPPSYRGGHPHWSFPPVVWRDLPAPQPTPAPGDPTGGLRWATWLSVATAATALLAAGAEIWRFTLMLQGRKLVLSGDVVRASDVLVAASGLAVVLAALLTVAAAVPALLQTHVVAAARLGRTPARTGRAIAARLLVPFWNVYGAGQIVMEIDGMLSASAAGDSTVTGRPRASLLTSVWWLSWVVSSLLMAATLARAFGGSLQAIADTVELHIALDLTAAVVAGLGAAMLHRFTRLLSGPKKAFSGWVVQPPEPTRPLPQPARSLPEPTEPTRPLPELARPLPEPTGKVPEPTGKVPEPAQPVL